jgi:FkbM family methyltransferase
LAFSDSERQAGRFFLVDLRHTPPHVFFYQKMRRTFLLLSALAFATARFGFWQHTNRASCDRVYVDMGTNIGHQIRKLYEPHLYPGNPTEIHFLNAFGADRRDVCAYGFEANPTHTERLQTLQRSYRAKKWNVTIHTETAVSDRYGTSKFYFDHGAAENNEWGAGLTSKYVRDKKRIESTRVRTVDIVDWLRANIHNSSVVVLKSDIEGLDEYTLTRMLHSGTLCWIDTVYGEHMKKKWIENTISALHARKCKTKLFYLDDESGDDSLPLP